MTAPRPMPQIGERARRDAELRAIAAELSALGAAARSATPAAQLWLAGEIREKLDRLAALGAPPAAVAFAAAMIETALAAIRRGSPAACLSAGAAAPPPSGRAH